jgi:predicted transcriptional regulator
MEVQLSPEQVAQLSQMADQTGRTADELAREVVERYIAEEACFRTAVQAGLDDAARGNFVPTSEVWAAVERELQD